MYQENKKRFLPYDGKNYNPLGGASYIFKDDIINYILMKSKKNKIKISIGAQPNLSPHLGTLTTIILSFLFAKQIKIVSDKEVEVLYEIIDTAPSETKIINGLKYQKSLRDTQKMDDFMAEYIEILEYLKNKLNVKYTIRYQKEFNLQKEIPIILGKIIDNREYIAKHLDPKNSRLKIRSSCPECGLSDKDSINVKFKNKDIIFNCPFHNEYKVNFEKESQKLEYNFALRNLIRTILYSKINNDKNYDYEILRITGSDYAGFYQEELNYKLISALGYDVSKLMTLFYAPLITDWSGAKLSKTLYVEEGAYNYLPKEFINYHNLKNKYGFKGLDILIEIIDGWIEEPYKLFRNYSIYYFMEEFKKYE